jgi:hypothetical protein
MTLAIDRLVATASTTPTCCVPAEQPAMGTELLVRSVPALEESDFIVASRVVLSQDLLEATSQ